jgi:hypothetical protein
MIGLVLSMFWIGISACSSPTGQNGEGSHLREQEAIDSVLDGFNAAAANADFEAYFGFLADDAVFTGTDATERWNKQQFMVWAKPWFDRKKTWSFQSVRRNICFDKTGNTAWFDELLQTGMKICRGSGVLIKEEGHWKIQQYVLSMTIPNSISNTVIQLKSPLEDSVMEQITHENIPVQTTP